MLIRIIPALLCAVSLNPPALAGEMETRIQEAMNDGLQLGRDGIVMAVADVAILKGGETARGDHLYVCNARLVWTVSRDELIARIARAAEREEDPVGALGEVIKGVSTMAFRKVSDFRAGDEVSPIRFRVRLEQAGDDWIAVESEVVERSREPVKSSGL